MLIKSYAKINLSLTVIKKIRKKRLHDIQSQFCLINLFDTISIKTNKKNVVTVDKTKTAKNLLNSKSLM